MKPRFERRRRIPVAGLLPGKPITDLALQRRPEYWTPRRDVAFISSMLIRLLMLWSAAGVALAVLLLTACSRNDGPADPKLHEKADGAPLTLADVQRVFANAQQTDPFFANFTLYEFSRYMNKVLDSQAYAAGESEGLKQLKRQGIEPASQVILHDFWQNRPRVFNDALVLEKRPGYIKVKSVSETVEHSGRYSIRN